MSPLKFVGGCLGLFLVVYVPLMIPWAPIVDRYARFFRAAASELFGTMGEGGEALFMPSLEPDSEQDTAVILGNNRTQQFTQIAVDSHYMGYVPTVFAAALTLALPYGWRRRLKLLAIVLVVMQGYVALRLLIVLLLAFGDGETGLGVFSFGSWTSDVLSGLMAVVNVSLAGMYVLPALIWGILTIRRSDLAEFRERLGIADEATEADVS